MKFIVVCLVAALSLATACASDVSPTVTRAPHYPLDPEGSFFVAAPQQRDRIEQSLVNAGLRVSENSPEANYMLSVEFGGKRRSDACGTVHNIAYMVFEDSRRVMVIKGRGATGACEPNILDQMSQELATHLGG